LTFVFATCVGSVGAGRTPPFFFIRYDSYTPFTAGAAWLPPKPTFSIRAITAISGL
jgi:hypothetical protein